MSRDAEVSTAVGDYLKRLYFLQGGRPEPVGTGEIAKAMGVSPPSATAMVRRLAREGLVVYERYRGVRLTEDGSRAAMAIIRRHRLVESLLHQVLGMDWTEVHAEAERLEHVVSEKLLDSIDRHLGYPAADPHGDPIPDKDGSLRHEASRRLSACVQGERVRIARVTRQDGAFLRFLAERGLVPGTQLLVVEGPGEAGVITVDPDGRDRASFSVSVAQSLLVVELE